MIWLQVEAYGPVLLALAMVAATMVLWWRMPLRRATEANAQTRVGRAWMAEAEVLAFNVSVPSEGLQGRSRLVRLSWTAAAGE